MKLARFGHHQDPVIDIEVEVEGIIGATYECLRGMPVDQPSLFERISRVDQLTLIDADAIAARETARACGDQLSNAWGNA